MTFADHDLARRLEGFEVNCTLGYALGRKEISPEADTAAVEVAGGCVFFFGAGSMLNEAKGLGMNGPVVDADFEAMECVSLGRGIAARVMVCPLADPTLLEGLARRGYRPDSFENVLYRTLDRSERFPDPPADFSFGVVGPEDARICAETLARGFSAPEEPDEENIGMFVSSARMPGLRNLLARSGGAAAGAASLLIDDDLAMLCGASTLPEFRNRGIQTALSHARLALAAASGCELVSIGAQPGSTSQRNAERLGFRVAYTKMLMVREPG